jgi:hypothetical protein
VFDNQALSRIEEFTRDLFATRFAPRKSRVPVPDYFVRTQTNGFTAQLIRQAKAD